MGLGFGVLCCFGVFGLFLVFSGYFGVFGLFFGCFVF